MSFRATLALTAALFAASAAAAVPHYRYTDLGVLAGDDSSTARAISQNGLIAGESGFGFQNNRVAQFFAGSPPVAFATLPSSITASTRGINSSGVAAIIVQGNDPDVVVDDRAALVSQSTATLLNPFAGYAAAGAFDVTDGGVAVGFSLDIGSIQGSAEGGVPVIGAGLGSQRATVWAADGTASLLAGPLAFGANTNAVSIGEDGQIAGIMRGSGSSASLRAVRWGSATGALEILTLGTGQVSSRAREINDHGWVAGQVFGPGSLMLGIGAVWDSSGNDPYLLTANGFVSTTTRGIDNSGNVVGFGYDAFDEELGFGDAIGLIWFWNGVGYDAFVLDTLVGALGSARTFAVQGINDAGQIVGFGPNQSGGVHAYLLTAVPEPGTWALMIGGFALSGVMLRRRRAAFA